MRGVLPLVVLAGCFGQKDTLGLPCNFPGDCDIGQDCVQGTCEQAGSGGSGETSTSLADASASTQPPGDLPPCEPLREEVALLRARIVLVVDHSTAAAVTWDDDGNAGTPEVPKHESLRTALVARLPELDEAVELGLALAPVANAAAIPDPGACTVDAAPVVPVMADGSTAVIAALPPGAPTGAAPIEGAMTTATTALGQLVGDQPSAVVLVLTGAANCDAGAAGDQMFESYADELHGVLASAAASGIPTAVVGVGLPDAPYPDAIDGFPDGVNPHDKAQLLADDGGLPKPGTDKYYRAQDGFNLGNSIRDAFFAARRCVLPLPAPLQGVPDFDVLVADQPLDELASCREGSGFVVGSATVEVCGSACQTLKAGDMPTATLQVECG